MDRESGEDSKTRGPRLGRRTALAALGVGVVGGAAAGAGVAHWSTAVRTTSGPASGAPASAPITRARWVAERGKQYFIAHRGSGDVYPEHSLEAYQAAIDAGATCMELSVGMTSDGRLICQHDTKYDRTTTAIGNVDAQPSTILRSVALKAPQLGPAWERNPARVAFFDDALRVVGGRAVLCLEAKVDAAYPSMMALVEQHGLADAVIVKAYYTSGRIAQAKAAGYPVFAYFGGPDDATPQNISTLAARLDPATDYLVLPAFDGSPTTYISDAVIASAVATGLPVWAYPPHRRADVAHFFGLGVAGAICSSYRYATIDTPTALADTWASGAIAPGEMTMDPSSSAWSPEWTDSGELRLAVAGNQHFLTLGQLSPLANAAASYRITMQASFATLPSDAASNLTIAFGHADDSYYQHQWGRSAGYHAILRVDGRLELFAHHAGETTGTQLGTTVQTPPPTAGAWADLQLDVTPTRVVWTRRDTGSSVTVEDARYRGGYVHVGRSATDGVLAMRKLAVTKIG